MIVKVCFRRHNKEIETFSGSTLLSIAKENGVLIPSPCGGNARCGGCRVKILKGNDQEDISAEEYLKLSDEKIAENYRLACSFIVKEDIVVDV